MFGVVGMMVLVIIDAFLCGFIYETKIQRCHYGKGIFNGRLWDWIYEMTEGLWNWVFIS